MKTITNPLTKETIVTHGGKHSQKSHGRGGGGTGQLKSKDGKRAAGLAKESHELRQSMKKDKTVFPAKRRRLSNIEARIGGIKRKLPADEKLRLASFINDLQS